MTSLAAFCVSISMSQEDEEMETERHVHTSSETSAKINCAYLFWKHFEDKLKAKRAWNEWEHSVDNSRDLETQKKLLLLAFDFASSDCHLLLHLTACRFAFAFFLLSLMLQTVNMTWKQKKRIAKAQMGEARD